MVTSREFEYRIISVRVSGAHKAVDRFGRLTVSNEDGLLDKVRIRCSGVQFLDNPVVLKSLAVNNLLATMFTLHQQ